jgi:predicted GIY-YIG superfamily endonuclease
MKRKGRVMAAELYRHYDEDDNLLYIGISVNTTARLVGHKDTSDWFKDISKITIEHFETRYEAEQAERKAIREENPICNVLRYCDDKQLPRSHAPLMPPHIERHYAALWRAKGHSKATLIKRLFWETGEYFDRDHLNYLFFRKINLKVKKTGKSVSAVLDDIYSFNGEDLEWGKYFLAELD